MTRPIHIAAIAAVLVASTAGSAVALAMTALPPVQKGGTIEYMTGGVGADQSKAIEKAGAHWPLTIVFAEKAKQRGEFVTDVKTVVRDAKGESVLTVDKAGPILLAKLSPGDYTIDATLAGKTMSEKVQVKQGHSAKTELMWPGGTAP